MFVSRDRLNLALHNLQEMRELHRRDVDFYRNALSVKDRRIEALTERIVELRMAGADTVPPVTAPVIPDPFGPLTRAALHDAGVGQSGIVKRGMRAKAEALLIEHRGDQNADEIVSIAVRNGEVSRR